MSIVLIGGGFVFFSFYTLHYDEMYDNKPVEAINEERFLKL